MKMVIECHEKPCRYGGCDDGDGRDGELHAFSERGAGGLG
jgi:hypothetical protein